VCAELFYTERAHVRNLKVMQQLFYQPMREDAAIGADFVALLFPNIDDMIELHGESGHPRCCCGFNWAPYHCDTDCAKILMGSQIDYGSNKIM